VSGVAKDFTLSCPVPLPPGETVLLGHGSGGKLTAQLIRELFVPVLGSSELARLGDAAVVEVNGTRLAFTTDSFVVQPAFFPGSTSASSP
jgi:hydrogenase expression/formation protein HypE